jgi:hypothetical protein
VIEAAGLPVLLVADREDGSLPDAVTDPAVAVLGQRGADVRHEVVAGARRLGAPVAAVLAAWLAGVS